MVYKKFFFINIAINSVYKINSKSIEKSDLEKKIVAHSKNCPSVGRYLLIIYNKDLERLKTILQDS